MNLVLNHVQIQFFIYKTGVILSIIQIARVKCDAIHKKLAVSLGTE